MRRSSQEQQQTQQALEREKETSYFQRIALAERELSAGNVGRAEELLDECPLDLRGWEWHFLKRQCYGNAAPLQHAGDRPSRGLQPGRPSSSPRRCVDGTVRIWDAQTGEALHTLRRRQSAAASARMAYSPDGRYLAVARQRRSRFESGRLATGGIACTRFEVTKRPAWQVAFSPDGRTLASAARIEACGCGTLVTSETTARPPDPNSCGSSGGVIGVAFSPDGMSRGGGL